MPASFGKPIWQAAKQLPKVHWSTEPEQFQLGRPDVCNDAVLDLAYFFCLGQNGLGQCIGEHTVITWQAVQITWLEPLPTLWRWKGT